MKDKRKSYRSIAYKVGAGVILLVGLADYFQHVSQFRSQAELTFLGRAELVAKFVALHRNQVDAMRNLMVEHYRAPSAENVQSFRARKGGSPESWELVAASGLLAGSLAGTGQLPLNDQQQREVNAAVAMDSPLRATLAGNPDVNAMYYVSAMDFLYAVPSARIDGFRFTTAYYQRQFWTQSLPASNPTRQIIMNGPYPDHTGQGRIITMAKPVYDGDRFLGVVALDLNLDMLQRLASFGESVGATVGETMLISRDNRVLVRQAAFDPEMRVQPPLSAQASKWMRGKDNEAWLSSPIANGEFWLVHRVKWGEFYWAAARDTATTWLTILMTLLIAASALTRAQLARDLRHSQKLYRLITENIDDVIWLMELPSRHFSYVSPSVGRLCGWRAEQIMDRELAATLDPDMYEKGHAGLAEHLDRIKAGDKNACHITLDLNLRHRDGHMIPIELVATILLDQAGEPCRMLGITRDITERVKVGKLKSEFISTVSHELRTPLTSIRGALGLLAGGAVGELPGKAKALVDIAHKNSERLVLLVNDILDLEKSEAGEMVFDMRPVDLGMLLPQALDSNRAYADQFNVRFELIGDASGMMLRVDQNRLLQVLANLLSNAVKFSPAGGVVSVVATRRDGQIRVTVRNGGPGIPAEFRNRIFQKFAQADSSDTRRKGGTGLGLAISMNLVEKMGGTIGFESEPDVMTEFFFEFPEWTQLGPET